MNKSVENYMRKYKQLIDKTMVEKINHLQIPDALKQSMLYSVEAGGKRIRPILLIASNEAYAFNLEKTLSVAVALEMIHTYSLIHDDLPAMDDDDFRRGKLTNHRVYGEATAILAGDALLTYSFEVIARDELLSDFEKVRLIKELAMYSGPQGMIAGQMLDLEAEDQSIDLETLETIHRLKTGHLLKFSILSGAFLGKASEQQLGSLKKFSHYLGLIFQIQDDILDVIGDEEKIGKPVGSDEANVKSTYPKLLGLEGAKRKKEEYLELAMVELKRADADQSYLSEIAQFLMHRDH